VKVHSSDGHDNQNYRDANVIQDYAPLAESLEWRLGQRFWHQSGSAAFLNGHVPYKITNDGNLSRKAAELLFAQLAEAEADGTLEERIHVLELGVGTGLFARYFLDALRALCLAHEKDYSDRLTYVAADRSEHSLSDMQRHGVLAEHSDRCEIRVADALTAGFGLDHRDVSFRAIFMNYLLDSLPSTVLKRDEDGLRELRIRTGLPPGINLNDYTSLGLSDLLDRIESKDPSVSRQLTDLSSLFTLRFDYFPISFDRVPFGSEVFRLAPSGACVLHNYGAIQCLTYAMRLLRDGGFVLVSDYGDSPFDRDAEIYRHQRFGGASAMGLNFPFLKNYFERHVECQWIEPAGDYPHLWVRLIGRNLSSTAPARFQDLFSRSAFESLYTPTARARELMREGRFEEARDAFQNSLCLQPRNWALLEETADLQTFKLSEYKAGLETTARALEINPIGPGLWNTHGDCLYYLERKDEAHEAYLRALELNPEDVRARYNLSFTLSNRADQSAALKIIAEALEKDRKGKYVDRLLRRQSEILNHLNRIREAQAHRTENRFEKRNSDGIGAPVGEVADGALGKK
jgi:tetratricopeptide (TPR) repeat protein